MIPDDELKLMNIIIPYWYKGQWFQQALQRYKEKKVDPDTHYDEGMLYICT